MMILAEKILGKVILYVIPMFRQPMENKIQGNI